MMRISQTFAEQKTVATLGASFGAMKGMVANKATTCRKEQVGVVFGQAGQSVKSNTIYFHKDGSQVS
jgi:hypothetical protein